MRFALLILLGSCCPCWADSIAITPEDPFYLWSSTDQTRGWAFTVETENFVVTKLGLFDEGGDGLQKSHAVSIWESSGDLLLTTTVPAGSDGELIGMFRYVDVPATELDRNGWYVIGSYYGVDNTDIWSDTDDMETDPAIFYRIDQWSNGNSFPDQLGRGVDPGFFGPNFQFVIVPEPSQAMFFALGFVVVLGLMNRSSPQFSRR